MLTACQTATSQKVASSDSNSAIDWSQAGPDAQKEQISFADVKADVEKAPSSMMSAVRMSSMLAILVLQTAFLLLSWRPEFCQNYPKIPKSMFIA